MHFHSKGTICRLQASHINHSEMTIPYFPPHIPYHSPIFIIHFPQFWVNHTSQNLNFWRFSRWWYTYPSEKYEFISWDDEIPNWMETINWCSKPAEKLASIGHVTSLFPKLPSLVVLGAALAIVLPMDLQHSETRLFQVTDRLVGWGSANGTSGVFHIFSTSSIDKNYIWKWWIPKAEYMINIEYMFYQKYQVAILYQWWIWYLSNIGDYITNHKWE